MPFRAHDQHYDDRRRTVLQVGVGGSVYRRTSLQHKATEQRLKKQRVMMAGPQRLGGGGVDWRSLDPGEAAALAATRRAADATWCGGEEARRALGGGGSTEVPTEAPTVDDDDVVVVRVVRRWACPACTFFNNANSLQCEMCGTDST